MNLELIADIRQYAAQYYNHSEVQEADSGAVRIYVPEADQHFLLGLGKFGVLITKIVPTGGDRIRISVMELKD